MSSINPYSRFSDPFISQNTFIYSAPTNPPNPLETPSITPSTELPSLTLFNPIIVKTIADLPNESIIVYRGTPMGYARGPNLALPLQGFEINNSAQHSQIYVNCTSTYPEIHPYNLIADRYEVRVYPDGWILTLADGCGLHISSKLAPAAAMKGFWQHLTHRLKNDQESFKVQKLAQFLYEAIEAAHFNIYWDAYLRNPDHGYQFHKQQVLQNLQNLRNNTELNNEQLQGEDENITRELNMIIDALKGDTLCQRRLIERNLNNRFYESYAGATTFFCSALIKNGSHSPSPYYLLSVSLGDCKGYLFRDGKLSEVTKDNREDISNARDPGGKIGLCTPLPLLMDNRNLQYSLTPCTQGDILFFMTDGVVDNLDPERLGLLPNARSSSSRILSKIKESASFTDEDMETLFEVLQLNATSWNQVSLEEGNKVKSAFGQKLLEKIIDKAQDPALANEKITEYCKKITSDFRNEKPHYFNLFEQNYSPIGKPDHTTCLTIKVQ